MGGTKCLRLGTCELEDMGGVPRKLGQLGIFQNLNENLPARAARENFPKFACPRAASEQI